MLAIFVLAGAGFAQEAGDAATPKPGAIIGQAFEKTKTASTEAELTEIIDLLAGLESASLSAEQADYAKKLGSWALNRRGEARSDLAAKATDEGKAEQAQALDQAALADFEAAIQYDPTRWKPYHNRGVSYALSGRYEQALADFRRSLELNRDYANTWFNLGEVHYELGRLEEAISDYSEAIRLAPNDADAFTSRAHTLFALGAREPNANRARRHFIDSVTDFNQVVRLNGGDAAARANRGDAYRALRRWQWAADDYRQAISLDPSLARAHAGLAWLLATCPEVAIRDAEGAMRHGEKAVELGGGDDAYLYLDALAAAQANAGRFDEAQATIAKAIEGAPESERKGMTERLLLYQNKQPYRQP